MDSASWDPEKDSGCLHSAVNLEAPLRACPQFRSIWERHPFILVLDCNGELSVEFVDRHLAKQDGN